MRETWYKLEDGNVVHPSEVSVGSDGALVHKSGVKVAMKGDVPHTWNVDPDEEREKQKPADKSMRPEGPRRGYKTRESKAE